MIRSRSIVKFNANSIKTKVWSSLRTVPAMEWSSFWVRKPLSNIRDTLDMHFRRRVSVPTSSAILANSQPEMKHGRGCNKRDFLWNVRDEWWFLKQASRLELAFWHVKTSWHSKKKHCLRGVLRLMLSIALYIGLVLLNFGATEVGGIRVAFR